MRPVLVVSGGVTVLDRVDVDTDQIIPKNFCKGTGRTGLGQYLLHDWLRSGEITLAPNPILVTGRNFGCGSSREHAVWALQEYGFAAVVAPSFGDIFASNCTKNGVLPVSLGEDALVALRGSTEATIDLAAQTVAFGGRTESFAIDPEIKRRLVNGLDDVGVTLEHEAAIAEYEARSEPLGPPTTTVLS